MFYAAAMFPVLAGFLAGGIAALNLPPEIRGQAAMYLFDGENYWQTVSSVLTKRLIVGNTGLFQYLDFFGIRDCFTDFIIGANKPNPDLLIAMIERHGLQPSECVVVGDRVIDMEGGRRAGIDGILFNPVGRVKEHCAKHVIRELSELFRFLPQ